MTKDKKWILVTENILAVMGVVGIAQWGHPLIAIMLGVVAFGSASHWSYQDRIRKPYRRICADRLRDLGAIWGDYDKDLNLGIEAEHPPVHKHYLMWMEQGDHQHDGDLWAIVDALTEAVSYFVGKF